MWTGQNWGPWSLSLISVTVDPPLPSPLQMQAKMDLGVVGKWEGCSLMCWPLNTSAWGKHINLPHGMAGPAERAWKEGSEASVRWFCCRWGRSAYGLAFVWNAGPRGFLLCLKPALSCLANNRKKIFHVSAGKVGFFFPLRGEKKSN